MICSNALGNSENSDYLYAIIFVLVRLAVLHVGTSLNASCVPLFGFFPLHSCVLSIFLVKSLNVSVHLSRKYHVRRYEQLSYAQTIDDTSAADRWDFQGNFVLCCFRGFLYHTESAQQISNRITIEPLNGFAT